MLLFMQTTHGLDAVLPVEGLGSLRKSYQSLELQWRDQQIRPNSAIQLPHSRFCY